MIEVEPPTSEKTGGEETKSQAAGKEYPGNDPNDYQKSIRENIDRLKVIAEEEKKKKKSLIKQGHAS